ncbi:hypothetical protein NEIG_01531 [Nematocida sp. ERTm5]|nr:hypothetical protein NEIG_01531 [Nematocida sp. ERTm5]
MVGHIHEKDLIDKIENAFIDKEGEIGQDEIDKLFNILEEIDCKRKIFISATNYLVNITYNIFYIKLFDKFIGTPISNYKKTVMDVVNKSIESTRLIINNVLKTGEEMENNSHRKKFYSSIGNNWIIAIAAYKIRKNLFSSIIDTLAEKEGIPKLNEKMSEEEVRSKLDQLIESKKCSRLHRAANILMKNGDNITIRDQNEIVKPNSSELCISKDDIYSMQLFIRANNMGTDELLTTLDVLDDILACDINEVEKNAYIYCGDTTTQTRAPEGDPSARQLAR